MAAVQRPSWPRDVEEQPTLPSLSGLERRCLLKHICECHELLQLTLLGAASARDKARGLEALMDLQEALRAAELQVAKAERYALRLLDEGYWD
jgi:hypothetical protein